MRHEHLAGTLVELRQIGKTSAGPDGVLHDPPDAFDVIVATPTTIDLRCHTQVYKLKRDRPRTHAVSASSIACMQHEGREVHDEPLVHAPATDGGRPAPVGAPPPGAHDPARTPGGQSWKSHSRRASRPVRNTTQAASRVNGARASPTGSTTDGRGCPSMRIAMMVSAAPGLIA